MRPLAAGLLLAVPTAATGAEVADLYRQVESVHWVVKDLERVKAGWARLGFPAQDLGEVRAAGMWREQAGSSLFRVALANLAGATAVWLQPIEGENAFTEHLARHGEGVVSINYPVGSGRALDAEVARLKRLGVGVLQRGEVVTPGGRLTVVHMDTAGEGKYVLGLVLGAAPRAGAGAPTSFALKLSQYALVVRSLEKVSAYWQKLGVRIVQSGGWGEKGRQGSGRFAYAATEAFGGVTTEFLWSFR